MKKKKPKRPTSRSLHFNQHILDAFAALEIHAPGDLS